MNSEASPSRKVPLYFPSSQTNSLRDLRRQRLNLGLERGPQVSDFWSQRQQLEFRKIMRLRRTELLKEREVRLLNSLSTSRQRLAQAYFQEKNHSGSPVEAVASPARFRTLPKRKTGRIARLDYLITDCDKALRTFRHMGSSTQTSPNRSHLLLSDLVTESVLSLKISGRKHFAPRGKPWQPIITD